MSLNKDALYSEACQAMRHYSNCVIHIRSITIAQGLGVLTAVYLLAEKGEMLVCLGMSVFGLALTAVLNVLHENYGRHHQAFLEFVVRLEDRIDEATKPGPWSAYRISRDARFAKSLYKLVIWSGPMLLLLAGMLAAMLYSLVVLLGSA